MLRHVVLILFPLVAPVASACGHEASGPSDCSVVHDDPAHALARLNARYPREAVRVATIIEGCVAPEGTLCERVALLVAAMPALMPVDRLAPPDTVTLCQQMPPSLQSCLLPSHRLARPDECTRLIDAQVKALTPSPTGCHTVDIYIDPGSITYDRGILSATGLEAGLTRLAKECIGPVAIHAASSSKYQDVVSTMDLAKQAGFTDIAFDTGAQGLVHTK
jgi:hypothetical protein